MIWGEKTQVFLVGRPCRRAAECDQARKDVGEEEGEARQCSKGAEERRSGKKRAPNQEQGRDRVERGQKGYVQELKSRFFDFTTRKGGEEGREGRKGRVSQGKDRKEAA